MTQREAYTIVELLVTITIIAILVAFLLPAVQAARETARRAQCANNLRNLGLAGQNHESAHGFLPSGGWSMNGCGDPDRGFGAGQPGGWIYHVLPYVESNEVWSIGEGLAGREPGGQKFDALAKQRSSVVPILHCPSRREATARRALETAFADNAAQPDRLARSDYAANAGTQKLRLTRVNTLACIEESPLCSFPSVSRNFDGIVAPRSQVRLAQINSGTSHTAMMGDKYLNPDLYNGASQCSDDNAATHGFDWDTVRWFPDDNGIRVALWDFRSPQRDTSGFEDCSQRFGSAHIDGPLFILCDGSIRPVPLNTDRRIYAALGSRD